MEKQEKKISIVPDNYTAVTPWIISSSTTRQIEFLEAVFGAVEVPNSRITNEEGIIIHVVVQIGDAKVMLFDKREGWGPTPSFLNIYVKDVKTAYNKALEMGATGVTEITPLWFGEEVCRIIDPFGNLFWINERIEEVDLTNPDEVNKRASTAAAMQGIEYIQTSLDEAMKLQRDEFL